MQSIDSETVMHRNMHDVVVTENGHFAEDFIFIQPIEQRSWKSIQLQYLLVSRRVYGMIIHTFERDCCYFNVTIIY